MKPPAPVTRAMGLPLTPQSESIRKMRAVVVTRHGHPEVLEVQDRPEPQPPAIKS